MIPLNSAHYNLLLFYSILTILTIYLLTNLYLANSSKEFINYGLTSEHDPGGGVGGRIEMKNQIRKNVWGSHRRCTQGGGGVRREG